MTRRELLEQQQAAGRLPPGFNIEAALQSRKARPAMAPADPRAPFSQPPMQPAGTRGRQNVVVAHHGGHGNELLTIAARVNAVADGAAKEAAAAIEDLAAKVEALTSRIAEVQAGMTALEGAVAAAESRLAAANAVVLSPVIAHAPVPDAVDLRSPLSYTEEEANPVA